MLDINQIKENPRVIEKRLNSRGSSYDFNPLLELNRQQRELGEQKIQLQTRSNEISKIIPEQIKSGCDPNSLEIMALRSEGSSIKIKIGNIEIQEKNITSQLMNTIMTFPNLPSESTPLGKNEDENVEVRRWGDEYIPENTASIMPHWEIGEKLGILNTKRAVKISQSRFVALIGAGAALERSLIQLMLTHQIAAGYVEVMPPVLVNTISLTATGQLPKFAEDSFKCADDDLWLSPTAEVPLTNLYRGEILSDEDLPIYHCAYTPCFRREAGSYGRDMRGLIRLHQFNKVEMVKLVHPNESFAELEKMVGNAETILKILNLPYRVVEICTGDLGFSSTKTYDLEVWLPSSGKYREISSCSNCLDFQSRRGNIRFKEKGKKGTKFVHTLNGSGLAVGRTMAAILENYQNLDGTVRIPEVLQPYLGRDLL
ncbi:serine--tRNA ligase [Richelia intracellularis]|uniref:serine--tRNA ligase n=1 Tax=Richelia intracellularis TaxID=1164990 RepID=UPI0005C7B38F|nr:serine--tRNA ligase [Richelia intracellularis]HAE06448.1 serine--tRNA ligase [Richelia sp.]